MAADFVLLVQIFYKVLTYSTLYFLSLGRVIIAPHYALIWQVVTDTWSLQKCSAVNNSLYKEVRQTSGERFIIEIGDICLNMDNAMQPGDIAINVKAFLHCAHK